MLRIFIPFAFRVRKIIQNLFTGYDWSSQTKLTNPTAIAGSGWSVDWSNDDSLLAIGHVTTPNLTLYQRSGDTFTKLTGNVSVNPAGSVAGLRWSPNNAFLACGSVSTPFINIYQRITSTTTLNKLANPSVLPTGTVNAVSWNSVGDILSTGHSSSPYITNYSRSGTVFTKLPNPTVLPESAVIQMNYSPDGTKLAVGISSSPTNANNLYVYAVSGTTFTRLSFPSTVAFGSVVYNTQWSPSGDLLIVNHNIAPYTLVYTVSGNTFTHVPSALNIEPTGNTRGITFSPDGQFMAITLNAAVGTGNLLLYKRSGNTFIKQTVTTNIVSQMLSAGFSNSGQYLAVPHSVVSPFLGVYKTTYTGTAPTIFREPKTDQFYSRTDPKFYSTVEGASGLPWMWNGADLGYEGDGPVTVGKWTYYKGYLAEPHVIGDFYGIYRTIQPLTFTQTATIIAANDPDPQEVGVLSFGSGNYTFYTTGNYSPLLVGSTVSITSNITTPQPPTDITITDLDTGYAVVFQLASG